MPPELALVEELVGRAAGSGLDVTLRLQRECEGLPAPPAQTAYRVVRKADQRAAPRVRRRLSVLV